MSITLPTCRWDQTTNGPPSSAGLDSGLCTAYCSKELDVMEEKPQKARTHSTSEGANVTNSVILLQGPGPAKRHLE